MVHFTLIFSLLKKLIKIHWPEKSANTYLFFYLFDNINFIRKRKTMSILGIASRNVGFTWTFCTFIEKVLILAVGDPPDFHFAGSCA